MTSVVVGHRAWVKNTSEEVGVWVGKGGGWGVGWRRLTRMISFWQWPHFQLQHPLVGFEPGAQNVLRSTPPVLLSGIRPSANPRPSALVTSAPPSPGLLPSSPTSARWTWSTWSCRGAGGSWTARSPRGTACRAAACSRTPWRRSWCTCGARGSGSRRVRAPGGSRGSGRSSGRSPDEGERKKKVVNWQTARVWRVFLNAVTLS